MASVKAYAEEGIEMASGDGVVRRCHPIFACFVGDYPEQVLVACIKYGQCPKCTVSPDELGELKTSPECKLVPVLQALSAIDRGPAEHVDACAAAGIKPIYHPFWEGLRFSHVFRAFTPDILHQLYQGVIKHLVSWLKTAFDPEELDAHCARMPPNHNLRLFSGGISHLSRVSGQEHKDICRVLLGLVIGLRLPGGLSPVRLVRAVRALLDFLYLAQYPSHSDETLKYLNEAMARFHANKDILLVAGVRENFNIPKLHSLLHYVPSIKLFGTTDNYNTEYSERLHIDYAKDAYRATNRKDVYPQMTKWLQRKEQVLRHEQYVAWRIHKKQVAAEAAAAANAAAAAQAAAAQAAAAHVAHAAPVQAAIAQTAAAKAAAANAAAVAAAAANAAAAEAAAAPSPPEKPHGRIHIARFPNYKSVNLQKLKSAYGAHDFERALVRHILEERNPDMPARQLARVAEDIRLPFRSVAAFNVVKFWLADAQEREPAPETRDAAYARPAYVDTLGRRVPGRFDTVLVDLGDGEASGIEGYRITQIRVIFMLSIKARDAAFPGRNDEDAPRMAYVEWFTPFARVAEDNHDLYRIKRAFKDGQRYASIISVDSIRRSVHLYPQFGPVAPRGWTSTNVLERCSTFFVNCFADRHTYITVY
ncbi:hypothetical protein BV25DRAFT_1922419 [Artomyces pyxidatus]|uniref:Uncharacterized protein n=1 Tax=Artomyces pyxidatus TaxID=48021 RepID=A0ACB8SG39_9AGAM|nr:hypothetical protein BV25DRAFT_1922419 [Artomyces pyxidatus]